MLAVGLGEAAEAGYQLEALRRAAGVAARTLAGAKKAALALPTESADEVEAVALGGLLGAYAFGTYKGDGNGKEPVGELVVLAPARAARTPRPPWSAPPRSARR